MFNVNLGVKIMGEGEDGICNPLLIGSHISGWIQCSGIWRAVRVMSHEWISRYATRCLGADVDY